MFLLRPLPVYAVDMPLTGLKTSELFVVCSLRLWVSRYQDPDGHTPDWQDGFIAAGLDPDAAASFDNLLRVVATSAVRSLDVRCQRCAHLGEDEGWLLQTLNLLQRDRMAEAAAILSHWLPPSAVRIATGPAQALAGALAAARLRLPLRHAAGASAQPASSAAHAECNWNLIH